MSVQKAARRAKLTDTELLQIGAQHGRPSVAYLPVWRAIEGDLLEKLCARESEALVIERMARAMAKASSWDGWDTARTPAQTPNGNDPEEERDYWRDMARAALASVPAVDEQEDFEQWCQINEYDYTHRLDGTGYNNDATRRASRAWHERASRAAMQMAGNVDAWAAVYSGGKRAGRIYSTCDTRQDVEAYIEQVHQSNDGVTLYARPLSFADDAKQKCAPAAPDTSTNASDVAVNYLSLLRALKDAGMSVSGGAAMGWRIGFPELAAPRTVLWDAVSEAHHHWQKWSAARLADDLANREESDATRAAWTALVICMEGLGKAEHADAASPASEVGRVVRIDPLNLSPDERVALTALVECASWAFHVADDGEDDGSDTIKVPRDTMKELEATLTQMETLPDDQPGYTMGPSGRAEWALRRFFGGMTISGQEHAARSCATDAVMSASSAGVQPSREASAERDMLMRAILQAGQKAGVIRADLDAVSGPQCLHILECLASAPVADERPVNPHAGHPDLADAWQKGFDGDRPVLRAGGIYFEAYKEGERARQEVASASNKGE